MEEAGMIGAGEAAEIEALDSLMLAFRGSFALCLTCGWTTLVGGFRLLDMAWTGGGGEGWMRLVLASKGRLEEAARAARRPARRLRVTIWWWWLVNICSRDSWTIRRIEFLQRGRMDLVGELFFFFFCQQKKAHIPTKICWRGA